MSLDIDLMLPSKAKVALTQLLFERIVSSGIYENAKPRFDYVCALATVENMGEYARRIMPECFRSAETKFDTVYPLCWDNKSQRGYRKGINDPD